MINLAELPDAGKSFILIDGAKVNGLDQVIYRQEDISSCDALYRGTELSDLIEISPWLVEANMNSSLARQCFGEWAHLGAAVLFRAECDFDELINHLRGLLMARVVTGDEVIFRFYDPEIARHLLKQDDGDKGVKRLLGPCSAIALQDRRTEEWECFYSDQPLCEQQNDVFKIREEHQVAMEKAAERTALRKLELHIASHFPHLLQQPSASGQDWEAVSALVAAAKARGLFSTRDIALYINTIGWLGQHAFEDSDIETLWRESSAVPGKAIARIAEFAEKKSTEGLVHG